MFNNIGHKIKSFAEIICCLGIIAALLYGFSVFLDDVLMGIIIMFLGSISAWVSALCIYGFGQLIENSDILIEKIEKLDIDNKVHISNIPMSTSVQETPTVTYDENTRNDIVAKMVEGKKTTLKSLFKLGEISDEEYQKLMEDLDS